MQRVSINTRIANKSNEIVINYIVITDPKYFFHTVDNINNKYFPWSRIKGREAMKRKSISSMADDREYRKVERFYKKYRVHQERRRVKEAIARGEYEIIDEELVPWEMIKSSSPGRQISTAYP